MKRILRARLALVAVAVALALPSLACSRGGASASRASPADAAPPPAPRDVPDGASSAAAAPDPARPGIEASAPVEIALASAPALTVRAVGSALIEITLADGGPTAWKTIEIERHVVAEELRQRATIERPTGRASAPESRRRVHSAKPGTTYAYRARAAGPWSAEVTVRTAEPGGAPPVPTSLAATPLTPFAVRLSWEADARMAAGFELQVASPGKDFVRAAVVDARVRELVHHHRLPMRAYTYRIQAFNTLGVSASSPVVPVTTPEHGGALAAGPPPPCKPLPAAQVAPKLGLPAEIVNRDAAHPLHNVPEGTNGLRRHLFGDYQGCLRDFGVFELQDAAVTEIEGHADEGFPLLRGIAGAGEFAGAQIETLRFSRGRYTIVDTAIFCGAPYPDPDPADPAVGSESADAVTGFAPPFATCQRDFER